MSVSVEYLKHPKNSSCVDHFFLVLSGMFDVEIYNIKQQVQNSDVATVQKSLEYKHEELLVQAVQHDLSLITFIFA